MKEKNKIFDIIKLASPLSYLNFINDKNYYIISSQEYDNYLNESCENLYSSNDVNRLDFAYISYQKGTNISTLSRSNKFDFNLTVKDQYIFCRRHFHFCWSIILLIFRIFSFNNPIYEIISFYNTLKIKRYNLLLNIKKPDLPLIDISDTGVSIIIPTLNRYHFLKDVLNDLENQTFKNFEVIIVDQSNPFDKSFYESFKLSIKIIKQDEKALWLARNSGLELSINELIIFTEDDVRINRDWIENHVRCIKYFDCDISNGVFFPEGMIIPALSNIFRYANQFSTGNVCIKKKVFKTIGLFDRQFEKQRMGDGEFGLRAFIAGFISINNPLACCIDIKAPVGGLRQMGSWDAFRPTKFWAPRPIPSVLYLARKYSGFQGSLMLLLINVPMSIIPYKWKSKKALILLSFLLSIFSIPLIFIQVCWSWTLASKKLSEGEIIKKIV